MHASLSKHEAPLVATAGVNAPLLALFLHKTPTLDRHWGKTCFFIDGLDGRILVQKLVQVFQQHAAPRTANDQRLDNRLVLCLRRSHTSWEVHARVQVGMLFHRVRLLLLLAVVVVVAVVVVRLLLERSAGMHAAVGWASKVFSIADERMSTNFCQGGITALKLNLEV